GQGSRAGLPYGRALRVGVQAGVSVISVHRGHGLGGADISGSAEARPDRTGVAVSVAGVVVARAGVVVGGQAPARVPDVRLGPARVAPGQVRSAVVAVAQLPAVRDGVQGATPYRDQADRQVHRAGVVLAYPEVAVRGVIRTLGARGPARGRLEAGRVGVTDVDLVSVLAGPGGGVGASEERQGARGEPGQPTGVGGGGPGAGVGGEPVSAGVVLAGGGGPGVLTGGGPLQEPVGSVSVGVPT